MKQIKAIELLKDYKNIDFGCNMDDLHSQIDEAIKELEAHIIVYQTIRNRLDNKVTTLAVLQNDNISLVKILDKIGKEIIELRKENQDLKGITNENNIYITTSNISTSR